MKTAVISGAGQDSSYLAEYLLSENYKVILFSKRKSSCSDSDNLQGILNNQNFKCLDGDIADPIFISRLLQDYDIDKYFRPCSSIACWI